VSQDEIKRQKAALFMEHSEAQEQVKHLREKALRIGRAFREFGALLEDQPETLIDISSQNSFGALDLIHYHPAQVEQLQAGAAFSVADELRKALRAVSDLEHRMRELGMRLA
jgi:hypothetical protein